MSRRLPRPGWLRRVSLRTRMIVLTAMMVATIVTLGAFLIVWGVRAELVDATDDLGLSLAADVAELVETGSLPATLPAVADDEYTAVQVVADGRVLSATRNLRGAPGLDLPEQPAGPARVYDVDDLTLDGSGPYRVVAEGVVGPDGPATVFVIVSLEDVEETVSSAARVGVVGLLLLVVALCAVMWVVIGRTLAPVEAVRARAEKISARHLDRRVPEPAYEDEIGRLARTVNAMLARLEDSAERQRRFVADAAHELRSPITSLRAQLETAQARGELTGAGPDLLAETLRMQTLVDQLLLLARSDAGTLRPARRAVDLDDSVEAAVSAAQTYSDVPVDVADVRPVQVIGDAALLEQVTRNLLDNAVRHADAHVRVTLASHASQAVLSVDDDGPGVPEQNRAAVFRRFTRLDAARARDGGGVGLGLAIVADIVAAHSGSIDLSSSPAGGARFTVRLPLDGTQSVLRDQD